MMKPKSKASQQHPRPADIRRLIELFNSGRFTEGTKAARKVIAQCPELPLAWKVLGACLRKQGQDREAAKAMRRAVELQPDDAEAHANLGAILKALGQLDESDAHLRRALALRPNFAGALNNLGNTLLAQNRPADAEIAYRRAVELSPNNAEFHVNLGNSLKRRGDYASAELHYRRALEINPENSRAHIELGILCCERHRVADAEAHYRRAIELQPDSSEAHSNLGGLLSLAGRFRESEDSLRRALLLSPDSAEAHNNLGTTLRSLGRALEAEANYRRALELKVGYAEAHNNLGNLLRELGRLAEAEDHCRQAIHLRPDYVEAHNNLGTILQDQGRLADAENSLRRALSLKPAHPEVHYNLGHVNSAIGRLYAAEDSYRQAIALNPYSAEAYNNLGNVLKDQGRMQEAEHCLREALNIRPDYADAHSNLLFTGNYVAKGDPQHYFDLARAYGRLVSRKATTRFQTWLCTRSPERIRIGFVSGDLNRHPVGHFLEGLIGQIDARRIEMYAYPTRSKEDELTARIRPAFGAWHSLVGLSDENAACRIHSDGVHILLDLSGHTAHNRLPVFAWKPSPVQVSWIGYFATTGVAEIDYLIADPWTLPAAEEPYFTERICRLPDTRLCFTAPDVDIPVSTPPALGNGYTTFGCFNNLSKVNDEVIALWARVLDAVPGSRLFLKAKQLNDLAVCERVAASFSDHGIDRNRLILEGPVPRAEYLATYNRVDIGLDPFPFPGGTTTVESLWMGVPVLTLAGERFLSRQGAGLVINAGMREWVAVDQDDYVARAAAYAGNPGRLASLRAGLRAQVLLSPIFDARCFARNVEAALWQMWQQIPGDRLSAMTPLSPEGGANP